ncbi:MAG: hypothetical protein E7523_10045 [Ruminococcaceae bacterium]|nr:hypothetical protein [Oscillospiraceae bacterium]
MSKALVQGLSEIYERVAQRTIFINQEAVPDVPENYIEKYERIYQLYKKLKSNKEIHCFVKDCSFGGKYPVVALIVVEKDTGCFGVKFGCHPDFGVALERCFTEAAQGRKINEFTKTSILDFQNNGVATENNICNAFKIAQGQYPFQLFSKKSTYDFTPYEEIIGSSNKILLKEWIDRIIKSGYDVLIRDVSYLDFPSFHIIIPGLSELQKVDDQCFRAYNTRLFSRQVLMCL